MGATRRSPSAAGSAPRHHPSRTPPHGPCAGHRMGTGTCPARTGAPPSRRPEQRTSGPPPRTPANAPAPPQRRSRVARAGRPGDPTSRRQRPTPIAGRRPVRPRCARSARSSSSRSFRCALPLARSRVAGMKKPLAVQARGAAAQGMPTRLGKEHNSTHGARVAHRTPAERTGYPAGAGRRRVKGCSCRRNDTASQPRETRLPVWQRTELDADFDRRTLPTGRAWTAAGGPVSPRR